MKLYNTPEKQVVDLKMDDTRPVTIYTCGPTVYDTPHIGNWYTFIRYDMLNRALKYLGYQTNWVMNITDVGHLVSDADDGVDKLEKGAEREGITAWDVAERFSTYFVEGLKRLNFSEVSSLPRATDYISEQIDLIKKLEASKVGYTYVISDGVYFDTSKFKDYADFAQLNLENQETAGRVEVNTEKLNPSDFALWKFSPKDKKRDMEWESPWGKGFPGWHLECSAMIKKILGQPIDIHAGGVDHIPVHHTNEIAQSFCAYNTPLSRYWMHCNHIQVDGRKMSKSLGNFYTLEDIENRGFSMLVFRLHVLSGHYRSQSEFNWQGMEATSNRLQSWIDILSEKMQTNNGEEFSSFSDLWKEKLTDDLNTPALLAAIDECIPMLSATGVQNAVDFLNTVLGLDLVGYFQPLNSEQQEILIKRQAARVQENWLLSDNLRNLLALDGIRIKDIGSETIWSRTI